ncbi:DNA-binding domain-containing protein [Acuticoccus sp. MNP-M23]|uniref:DNA-binding domain-containing protein n=1 Tax=Acuticoccus sp. MNP-M23 TaxID=3072793 RepID=UPI00281550CD|nr:DNA-binding domain-containing protein [Acuticoccus sp. MNP-M23]WMS41301.1 DNA-binding domain-containing protein [Acuticoccus sp. MNP-M23]
MQRPPSTQDRFLKALAGGTSPEGLSNGRGRPAPDRMDVYRNNVAASLRDSLRTTFATTARLMGDAFFDAAAVDYARQRPPQSPILARYGATFADFLAQLPGLTAYPFVPEVGRIEFARVTAYHAADAEPLGGDALADLGPQALVGVQLVAHPATALIRTPAGGLAAFQANQTPPLAQTPAAAALVTRPAFTVLTRPLDDAAATFAENLLHGAPLGEAAQVQGLDLAGALAQLLSAGAFHTRVVPTG